MTLSNTEFSNAKKAWTAPSIEQFRVEDITNTGSALFSNDGNGPSTGS